MAADCRSELMTWLAKLLNYKQMRDTNTPCTGAVSQLLLAHCYRHAAYNMPRNHEAMYHDTRRLPFRTMISTPRRSGHLQPPKHRYLLHVSPTETE
eukprot:264344-Amphidinium_carterae.1